MVVEGAPEKIGIAREALLQLLPEEKVSSLPTVGESRVGGGRSPLLWAGAVSKIA